MIMLSLRYLSKLIFPKGNFSISPINFNKRNQSDSSRNREPKNPTDKAADEPLGDIGSKYEIFEDKCSEVILDVYEEQLRNAESEEKETHNPFEGINLERGTSGVFEIDDLVDLLYRENAEQLFVAKIPKDVKFADFICVVTGKSHRHMQALTQFVRRVYKQKMNKSTDLIPRLEGASSKDWMALDLGNIALHVFSRDARLRYDLDSLWAVGSQFDDESNKEDPIAEVLEKHSIYLNQLQPAS